MSLRGVPSFPQEDIISLPVNTRPIVPYTGNLAPKPDSVCPQQGENFKAVALDIDWTQNVNYNGVIDCDLGATAAAGSMSRILSVYIDNANVPNGVVVAFPDTTFTVTCPEFTQRWSQVISGAKRVQIYLGDAQTRGSPNAFAAGTTRVWLMNSVRLPAEFKQPPAIGVQDDNLWFRANMASAGSATINFSSYLYLSPLAPIFRVTSFKIFHYQLYTVSSNVNTLQQIQTQVFGGRVPTYQTQYASYYIHYGPTWDLYQRREVYRYNEPFNLDLVNGFLTGTWAQPDSGFIEWQFNGYYPAVSSA